jgi:hypothetical protein
MEPTQQQKKKNRMHCFGLLSSSSSLSPFLLSVTLYNQGPVVACVQSIFFPSHFFVIALKIQASQSPPLLKIAEKLLHLNLKRE